MTNDDTRRLVKGDKVLLTHNAAVPKKFIGKIVTVRFVDSLRHLHFIEGCIYICPYEIKKKVII